MTIGSFDSGPKCSVAKNTYIAAGLMGGLTIGLGAIFLLQMLGSSSYWGASEAIGKRTDANLDNFKDPQYALWAVTSIYAFCKAALDVRTEIKSGEIRRDINAYHEAGGVLGAGFFGFCRGATNPVGLAVAAMTYDSRVGGYSSLN